MWPRRGSPNRSLDDKVMHRIASASVVFVFVLLLQLTGDAGQSPSTVSQESVAPTGVSFRHAASLAQVMRGITFPNANILFNTQNHNPADLFAKKAPTPGAPRDFLECGYVI